MSKPATIDLKDLPKVKAFFTNLQTQFASAAAIYEGPTKALFEEFTTKFNEVISALPKDGEGTWCLTDNLDWLFSSLSSCTALCNSLVLELNKAKTMAAADTILTAAIAAGTHLTKAAHDEAVTAAVAAAIAQRTADNGDLVPRAQVNQLCSAAKITGEADGRAALTKELADRAAVELLVTTRKTALTTAGLPLPSVEVESILRESDDVFNAARTLAETRLKGFTDASIELTPELAVNVWDSEKEFGRFNKLVISLPGLKRTTPPAEPFAPGPGAPPAGRVGRMIA